MEGGETQKKIKLINDGGYGCIFRPGINCKGTTDTNTKYITKIQKSKRSIQNEWRIAQKIHKIPGYALFFAPIIKQCKVHLTKDAAKEVNKCAVFKSDSEKKITEHSYVSTKIRYVGDANLKYYLLKNVSQNRFLFELFRTHAYLLKSVQKMADNKIIHYDVKYGNIVVDAKLNAPIIVDFGLSFSKEELISRNFKRIFYTFQDYDYWCIDILVCSFIFGVIGYEKSKNVVTKKDYFNVIYNVFMYGTASPRLANDRPKISAFNSAITKHSEKVSEFKQKYDAYFAKFENKTWWTVYEEMIKYWDTWDNYSLAVTYLEILEAGILQNQNNGIKMTETHLAQISNYVTGLEKILYSMPDERISIADTEKYIPK